VTKHAVPLDVAYRHEVIADAPAEAVWEVLTDYAGYASWSMLPTSTVVRPGDADGVGAARFFGGGRIGATEEVVDVEPGRRLVYRIVGGVPVASYRGEVILEPVDGRTRIVWRGGVGRGPRPLRRVVSVLLGIVPSHLARGVAREAERRVRS
jgi:uncharacterized protein YndB with AHSA1/START domain